MPGHWVLQGDGRWGSPICTNTVFPFPVEPPFVPDANPTGDHPLSFDLPDGFLGAGDRAHLRFGGVESVCVVSLNGLTPEFRAPAGSYPITVALPDLGIERTFASPGEVGPIEVPGAEPWSADHPRLYEVVVGDAVEERRVRVRFRRVEIAGHEWRVDGRKLRIRGVNRQELDPDRGRMFDVDAAREALCLVKRHNINAIRTSH